MEDIGLRYKAAIERGLSRFVDESKAARAAMDAVTEAEARAIGVTLEEAREVALGRYVQEHVKALGRDLNVFLLYQGATSDEELALLLAHRQKSIDSAIGL
ncbi:hypothetical protein OII53_06220 [Achromobacter ruhlandii]|uniref:hypothetical protein n=1 Tax=Achromobacter ruhlandii TaxID=72557 RepID=UPI0021F0C5E3|nr:hypothetical protein [Achromobacter ruhlandii]MCV6795806.1 hypothetical protein [Achromobacter ruhlandii]MCV6802215.1 hypothetical protein [Achromobacter ruhlandii]MCV6807778.1 hypothetical protein [Achromobacter ruhlandii]MCV6818119.1 hypothetical protein [Achromobacter ruhlandii]